MLVVTKLHCDLQQSAPQFGGGGGVNHCTSINMMTKLKVSGFSIKTSKFSIRVWEIVGNITVEKTFSSFTNNKNNF